MTSKNQFSFLAFFVLVAVVVLWGPMAVGSQGVQGGSSFPTAFTYQGQLKHGGNPVHGTTGLEFTLYDAASGGQQIGNTVVLDAEVVEGIFTVGLDFGPGAFEGGPLWLEVATKDATLEPRQQVNPAPYVGDLLNRVEALEAENAALQELLAGVTRENLDGYDTLRFSGMNVQIVNGTNNTFSVNGRGNLIVGYNELRTWEGAKNIRTGSHYVIIGQQHNYSSHGGIVAGFRSTASGSYASVTGGWGNTASGFYASVSGGQDNTASAQSSSVSGGAGNQASGLFSSVSGGESNQASVNFSSVSGGQFNQARSNYTSVSGGQSNKAGGDTPDVGQYASILGGQHITVDTAHGIYPQ